MSAIFLDAQFVRAEIGRLLADYPEMADDARCAPMSSKARRGRTAS